MDVAARDPKSSRPKSERNEMESKPTTPNASFRSHLATGTLALGSWLRS